MADNEVNLVAKMPKWAVIGTALWIILCLGVGIKFYSSDNPLSLSDIGGYISGVFAPVAWL
ncbi:hypothetical protein [Acinetobacter sp. c3-l95]|uniref:hypothetical protein n=1 Tax=Acinetobacter sp. c3-l95 TaxID=3342804 RepID=UPI0035B99013